MRVLQILLFITMFNNVYGATECVRNSDFGFSSEGTKKFGKVRIRNYFKNGECTLMMSVNRNDKKGSPYIEEMYSFSENGKLSSTVMSANSFSTSTNSRATGSRSFYVTPRVKNSVGYTHNEEENTVTMHMPNGEDFIISTESGDIVEITGTKWRRDKKALRSFHKDGKLVGQYVHSENCINCGNIHSSLKGKKESFSSGGLIIEGLEEGVVIDTKFRRGGDPRAYQNMKSTFTDKKGRKCSIGNKFIYAYELDYRGEINGIKIKFENDQDKFPTRTGMTETFPEFLKRVCKNKGIANFDVSSMEDDNCIHCEGKIEGSQSEAIDLLTPVIEKLPTNP